MKQNRRSKHVFRAMTRHREGEEIKTPNTYVDSAEIPHSAAKRRTFLRRSQHDTSHTPHQRKEHPRTVLTNSTNVPLTVNKYRDPNPTPTNTQAQNRSNTQGTFFNANTTGMNTTGSTEEMIIRDNLGSAGITSYDYKTFSTGHPLRMSKIKAFEQSELTHRLFFRKFDVDDVLDGEASECEDIIVQIPNLSREETKRLVDGQPTFSATGSGVNKIGSLDRRLNLMKNAFKPVSKTELAVNKLQNLKLPNVFQNSPDFLKSSSIEDLETLQILNDEFEQEMKDLSVDIVNESKRKNCLSISNGVFTLVDAPFDQLYEPSAWRTNLGMVLSHDVRKRIKEELSNEDQRLM